MARNIPAEQNAAKDFVAKYKKVPSTPQDMALVYKFAYPQLDNLPEELKGVVDNSLWQSGAAAPTNVAPNNPQQLTQSQQNDAYVQSIRGDVAAAQPAMQVAGQNLQQSSPANLGGAFAGIQRAIRTKAGTEEQSIGPSEMYQAAGLNGFETLQQSLSAKAKELGDQNLRLDNVLSELGGQFRTSYESAKNAYTMASSEYKDAVGRLDKVMGDLANHERQMEIIRLQDQLQRQRDAISRASSGSSGLSDVQQTKVSNSRQAKNIEANLKLKEMLSAYKELVKKHGFEGLGQGRAALSSAYSALQIAYKNAAELGAITGPDMAIIEGAIVPASGVTKYPSYVAAGGAPGVIKSIDQITSNLDNTVKADRATLQAQWGTYADDPYIKNLLGTDKPGASIKDAAVGALFKLGDGRTVRKVSDTEVEVVE